MNRRLLSGAIVGALVLASVGLVVLALRPSTPPPAGAAPIEIGALAVQDGNAWRWSGPRDCNPDTDIIQLERRIGDGDWVGGKIPLINVYGLTFNDSDDGVAIGTVRGCGRGVVISQDGGRTWHYRDDNPVLLDAAWSDRYLWGIERGVGAPALKAYDLRNHFKLVEVNRLHPTTPCDARDGTATQVAFYSSTVGLLLCEQQITNERLVARTTTSGAAFDRIADGQPDTGLDGAGPITDLEVAGRQTAWVLFSVAGECPEGQLRRSDSQGAVWERLPCVSDTVPIDRILDVAFATQERGTMLATDDSGAVIMLETADAGTTWTS